MPMSARKNLAEQVMTLGNRYPGMTQVCGADRGSKQEYSKQKQITHPKNIFKVLIKCSNIPLSQHHMLEKRGIEVGRAGGGVAVQAYGCGSWEPPCIVRRILIGLDLHYK